MTGATHAFAGDAEPHWINSGMNNRDLTLSPDGRLLLSTLMAPANQFAVIVVSEFKQDRWQAPEIAPFSGRYPDIEPMFSPEGRRVFFASTRPKPDRDGEDWDIWWVSFDNGTWGEPVNAGAPINTPANEFYPSLAANGNLYFTAAREGGAGGEDIFRAIATGASWSRIEPVGDGVNTKADEFNAFVSPDERYIIFSATGREDSVGRGDLYISDRGSDGEFAPARLLPAPINSVQLDYCPFVRGDRFYFSSRRQATITGFSQFEQAEKAFESEGNGLGDIYSVPLNDVLAP